MITQVRNGDVLFTRVGDCRRESGSRKIREIMVAVGEATGHAHVVRGPGVRRSGDLLSVPDGADILHPEHVLPEKVLEPGEWRVTLQQTWVDAKWRRVAD